MVINATKLAVKPVMISFDEVSTFQEGFQDYLCREGERLRRQARGP
jgi:hypothetical protein